MRRCVTLVVVAVAIALAAAACSRAAPGWTYVPASITPAPSQSAPTISPSPSPAGSPSPSPAGSPSPAVVTIRLAAEQIAFDRSTFAVPADTPFDIVFDNRDVGIPHNVAIYEGQAGGPVLFRGDIFNGRDTRTYHVPGLPAGDHFFVCDVHPVMNGTVEVR